jgi:uncharacterized protein (TIRG00374 family)
MRGRFLQILIGLAIAALFLVLSVRTVDLAEVFDEMRGIKVWWIMPYFLVVVLSNLARAERWKMLLDDETGVQNSRLVMVSGVMYGYIANLAIPRAGELFRAVYASRFSQIKTTKLFGTIVLERIIDLFMMMIMIMITFVLLVRDQAVLRQLFGDEGAIYVGYLISTTGLTVFGVGIMVFVVAIWMLRRKSAGMGRAQMLTNEEVSEVGDVETPRGIRERVNGWAKHFVQGIISIRRLRNWPLFVFYTIFIWFTYVVTSLMPFWAFGFETDFGFGWEEAFVITIIGGIGVVLPSPGGIGTYHYMVQTGLMVLYSMSAVTALSYATVSHFVNVSSLILFSVILVVLNQLRKHKKLHD